MLNFKVKNILREQKENERESELSWCRGLSCEMASLLDIDISPSANKKIIFRELKPDKFKRF